MGAKVQGYPMRTQPHEGSSKGPSSSLYGHPGATNRIPIHSEVLHFPIPAKFRIPQIEMFDGTKDPIDTLIHTKNRWNCMDIRTPYDAEPSLSH